MPYSDRVTDTLSFERPVPYTIPADGPVGRMLESTGRHAWRPAHIHLIVRAPGYCTVATQWSGNLTQI